MDVLPQVMLGGVVLKVANVPLSGQEVGLILWQSKIREGCQVFGGHQLWIACKLPFNKECSGQGRGGAQCEEANLTSADS